MFSLFDMDGERASQRDCLSRIEAKLDRILDHLGIEFEDPSSPNSLSDEVQQLLASSRSSIDAIKLHRQQTGASLRDAKRAIDAYRATQLSH